MGSDTAVLVVAAGRGTRFGGPTPKTYARLAGRTVLRRSLEAFALHPRVAAVRAVIHPDDAGLYAEAAAGLDVLPPVAGGDGRQDSVRLGLESLEDARPGRVLIHDGARPIVPASVIDRVLDRLEDGARAVLPALAVTDTLKLALDGRVIGGVPRDRLYRVQTPQGFAFADLLAAHRRCAGAAFTDDGAVAETGGMEVTVVEGDERNLKITAAEDLARAEAILRLGLLPRTGFGYDVHRFGAPAGPGGRGVTLCGVAVPHERPLLGHSDADVGLHALTDAILGALCAGDIGRHFPPSDPRWAGADSVIFLEHARDLVAEAGGMIHHVDVTLVCERPRIGPHAPAMIARIGEALRLPPGTVGVKATTTEGLGFTGRAEGIAAHAVATVLLP